MQISHVSEFLELRTMELIFSEVLQKCHAKTEAETEQKRDRERGLELSQFPALQQISKETDFKFMSQNCSCMK